MKTARKPESLNVNPLQFINPKTKEASYILGLLWADGYLYHKNYTVNLEIKEDDAKDLYKLFSYTGKWGIFHRIRKHWKPQTKFMIGSKQLYNFLLDCGYGPHNELSPSKILNIIPINLHYMWYRGYFDGDGCFYYKKGCANQMCITSSYNQDWSFIEQLFTNLGIKYAIKLSKNSKNSSSCIRCSNLDGINKFGNFIYHNYDNLGLNRKYQKYLLMTNH